MPYRSKERGRGRKGQSLIIMYVEIYVAKYLYIAIFKKTQFHSHIEDGRPVKKQIYF